MQVSAPITFRTVSQIKIAEAIAGEGQPVLLLHGWGANIELVWALGEHLVKMGYRVYALDMPGFGQSDYPPTGWTVFDYAKFIIHYMDAHHLEKVHLFGHSFGGRLGLILGSDYAERICKMALADSAGVLSPTPMLKRARLGVYKGLRNGLESIGAEGLSTQLRTWYGKRYGSADYQSVSGVMRETFVKVVNQDLLPHAARVTVPTILFWGDKDDDTPLWMGQLLEKTIPDAALIVHEGAGHYSYLEFPEKTARVMDALFKQA